MNTQSQCNVCVTYKMVNVLTLLGEVDPSSNEVCELLMTPPDPPGSLSLSPSSGGRSEAPRDCLCWQAVVNSTATGALLLSTSLT